MTAIVCNVEVRKSNIWCLDSGATKHMSNERQKFTVLNESIESKVYTASDQWLKTNGVGEIEINIRLNNKTTNRVKLTNAIYVPELKNNLISIPQITKNGFKVIFYKNHAVVKRNDGTTAMIAQKRNELYVVDIAEDGTLQTSTNPEKSKRWHQRFGHLNYMDLKNLQTNNMVKGLNLNTKNINADCEICARGKIHQLPFKSPGQRQKEKLGLVHSDICGPMNKESLGGAKYFATFTDDYTRYTETVMLRQRSDVLTAFKNFKKRVEKETGCVIKRLRTDNAKEYTSKEFKKFLEDEGIARQLSVEYTPQQNGVAERINRTLVEMARCLMIQAELPQSLWAEAINTATFLRNRCPTKSLDDKTPYEAWFGEKPYVGFLRIIGSKVIALNKSGRCKKFDPKGLEYVLVGYSQESKAYRLWRRNTNTVIKARDVKFFEIVNEKLSSDIFIDLENSKEEISKQETDDEEIDDNNSDLNERNDELQEEQENVVKRGPGRPKIQRTGNVGRPKKIYTTRSSTMKNNMEERQDPITVDEALEREDADF